MTVPDDNGAGRDGAADDAEERRGVERLATLLQCGTLAACVLIGAGLVEKALGSTASGSRIVTSGIALVLAQPVAGLLALLVSFLRRREAPFAGITALVLAIVAVAFAIGALF